MPAMVMHENITKALSVWLSVLTSLVGALSRSVCLCVFIEFAAVCLLLVVSWLFAFAAIFKEKNGRDEGEPDKAT